MIDFLKADIEPAFVESSLPPGERGKLAYIHQGGSGAVLAGPRGKAGRAPESVTAVILGPCIHRYASFRLPAGKLASSKGRSARREWKAFRDSFAASQGLLRERLINASRLAPKGREAELMMEYVFRFLDRPMSMADTCAGSPGQAAGPGRCYVATAVYGSPSAPEVEALRRFRDRTLMECAPGRAFVRLYYALSPGLARRLGESAAARGMARRALDLLVRRLPG
jgi:hypothetical protein